MPKDNKAKPQGKSRGRLSKGSAKSKDSVTTIVKAIPTKTSSLLSKVKIPKVTMSKSNKSSSIQHNQDNKIRKNNTASNTNLSNKAEAEQKVSHVIPKNMETGISSSNDTSNNISIRTSARIKEKLEKEKREKEERREKRRLKKLQTEVKEKEDGKEIKTIKDPTQVENKALMNDTKGKPKSTNNTTELVKENLKPLPARAAKSFSLNRKNGSKLATNNAESIKEDYKPLPARVVKSFKLNRKNEPKSALIVSKTQPSLLSTGVHYGKPLDLNQNSTLKRTHLRTTLHSKKTDDNSNSSIKLQKTSYETKKVRNSSKKGKSGLDSLNVRKHNNKNGIDKKSPIDGDVSSPDTYQTYQNRLHLNETTNKTNLQNKDAQIPQKHLGFDPEDITNRVSDTDSFFNTPVNIMRGNKQPLGEPAGPNTSSLELHKSSFQAQDSLEKGLVAQGGEKSLNLDASSSHNSSESQLFSFELGNSDKQSSIDGDKIFQQKPVKVTRRVNGLDLLYDYLRAEKARVDGLITLDFGDKDLKLIASNKDYAMYQYYNCLVNQRNSILKSIQDIESNRVDLSSESGRLFPFGNQNGLSDSNDDLLKTDPLFRYLLSEREHVNSLIQAQVEQYEAKKASNQDQNKVNTQIESRPSIEEPRYYDYTYHNQAAFNQFEFPQSSEEINERNNPTEIYNSRSEQPRNYDHAYHNQLVFNQPEPLQSPEEMNEIEISGDIYDSISENPMESSTAPYMTSKEKIKRALKVMVEENDIPDVDFDNVTVADGFDFEELCYDDMNDNNVVRIANEYIKGSNILDEDVEFVKKIMECDSGNYFNYFGDDEVFDLNLKTLSPIED